MKVRCEVCQGEAWGESSEDHGRELRLVCKGCGTTLLLDAEERKKVSSEAQGVKRDSSQRAVWYVSVGSTPIGPVRFSTLAQLWSDGVVNRDSLVWKANWKDWRPLQALWGKKESTDGSPEQPFPLESNPASKAAPGGGHSWFGGRLWQGYGVSVALVLVVLGAWGYFAGFGSGGAVEVTLEVVGDGEERGALATSLPEQDVLREFQRAPVALKAAPEPGEGGGESDPARSRVRPSRTEIVAGVQDNLATVLPCIEEARERGDLQEGSHAFLLDWVIQPGGGVAQPRVKAPEMVSETKLSHCFETAMIGWRFTPSLKGAPVVNYSFGPFHVHL